jgi:hypothetical protein
MEDMAKIVQEANDSEKLKTLHKDIQFDDPNGIY